MKKIVLPTGRPYSGKLFWVLLGLNAFAVAAVIPFALTMQRIYSQSVADSPPGWTALLADQIGTLVIIGLLIRIGLALGNRLGLGSPFLESWLSGEPPPGRLRDLLARGLLIGIGLAVVILAVDFGVFQPGMASMVRDLNLPTPARAVAPPLYGLLAAVSAGITEETAFRLFGLSLFAWMGGFLVRAGDHRPSTLALWSANVIWALLFGAAHLGGASALGLPLNVLVLTRTFFLNGLAGLAFGWLFWTYGLESAMLAHFFTDVGLYCLLPAVLIQEGPTAKTLVGVFVAICVVLSLSWAGWTMTRYRCNSPSTDDPGSE